MDLLRELTTEHGHVPIMEALAAYGIDLSDLAVIDLNENTRGGKVTLKGAARTAGKFMQANPALVIGAAALAVNAYATHKRNKRNTITLHAKDPYERKMITSIVDALTQNKRFRVVHTKYSGGGKTWVLRRVGV